MSITLGSDSTQCNAGSDGAVNVVAIGGQTPYSYQWSNGSLADTVANIPAGMYFLTVTDGTTAGNCSVTGFAAVGEPSAISLLLSSNDVCLGSADGAISAVVMGGNSPYMYSWSVGGAAGPDLTGLTSGTFTVTVVDVNTCAVIDSATITTLPLPTVIDVQQLICESVVGSGQVTGVDLTPFETLVNPLGGMILSWGETDQVTPVVNPSSASFSDSADYYLLVDDGICADTAEVQFNVLSASSIALSGGGVQCADGSNTVEVQFDISGVGPHTFSYLQGADTLTVTNYTQTTYVPTDVQEGIYTLLDLTNAAGCVSGNNGDTITVSIGGPTADFAPGVSNGDPMLWVDFENYSTHTGSEVYHWDFGTGEESAAFSPSYGYTQAGSYEVRLVVTDILGCTDTAAYRFIGSRQWITNHGACCLFAQWRWSK